MNIEDIPQIITEIQDDIKTLKSAINPKPAVEGLKVLLKDGSFADDDAKLKLEDIKGITVPLLNGKRVLVYPKFKDCELLSDDVEWKGRTMRENDVYYNESDGRSETDELLALGSKAAKFVRSIGNEFNLPHNALILVALYHFREQFNDIVKRIDGADALTFPAWSSAMYNGGYAWLYYSFGYFINNYFCNAFTAVPCVLL